MSRETIYALRRLTEKMAQEPVAGAPAGVPAADGSLRPPAAGAAGGAAPGGMDVAGLISALSPYMPSLSQLAGIGIGGAGAYGLSRMFQSDEDEKRRFPWLATLGGAAAGGYLLPELMKNEYVQGGLNNAYEGLNSGYNSVKDWWNTPAAPAGTPATPPVQPPAGK